MQKKAAETPRCSSGARCHARTGAAGNGSKKCTWPSNSSGRASGIWFRKKKNDKKIRGLRAGVSKGPVLFEGFEVLKGFQKAWHLCNPLAGVFFGWLFFFAGEVIF